MSFVIGQLSSVIGQLWESGVSSGGVFHFRDSYLPALERRGAVMPAAVEALNRQGRRLRERGEVSAAIAKHQEALRLKNDAAATHQNLALAWWRRGNLREALAAYRRVMELRPRSPAAHSDYLYALYHDSDVTPSVLTDEARKWATRFAGSAGGSVKSEAPSQKDKERRLRVGYVSADFRRHTLRHFIMPLLKHHDRQRFEVYCYSNVGEPDRVTELVQPLADQWRDVKGLKAAEFAELIRRDDIDILVDLSGHMGGNRLTTFALRAAPVQVQIYFAGTSGLPQMDYRITDAYSDPPGMTDQFHTEKLVRLPACAWPYEPEENTPNVGPLPAISNGHITFGSMNRPIKISERMIELWSHILRAVPNSKLMFLADAMASDVDYHYQRFARHGIGPERLLPLARTPRRKYLDAFNRIDFCLDTFPYAGDTTTCDALWMGVPTLTLAGDSFHSRRGVSHLSNVGLQDWIAGNEEEYVQKAVAFAQDVPALVSLRGELLDRMRQSPLMDFVGYARRLEEAYRQMWGNQSGQVQPCALQLASAPSFDGQDELEVLREFFRINPPFQTPAGCGVVTASDGNLFRGLQMLLLSINGHAPVTVFDLGLDEEQLAWCVQMPNVRLMKPSMLPVPKSVQMWQGWNKPFYLKASPFECSLWIDADAFVVGDLSPLFAKTAKGFWVIKHQLRYPKANDTRLYKKWPVHHRFPLGFHLNSGVVGFHRGDDVIETWASAVLSFASDPQACSWTSYFDEGALHWAIESLDRHDLVIQQPQWNRLYFDLGRQFPTLDRFVQGFNRADNVIVHATGPKLWSRWDRIGIIRGSSVT